MHENSSIKSLLDGRSLQHSIGPDFVDRENRGFFDGGRVMEDHRKFNIALAYIGAVGGDYGKLKVEKADAIAAIEWLERQCIRVLSDLRKSENKGTFIDPDVPRTSKSDQLRRGRAFDIERRVDSRKRGMSQSDVTRSVSRILEIQDAYSTRIGIDNVAIGDIYWHELPDIRRQGLFAAAVCHQLLEYATVTEPKMVRDVIPQKRLAEIISAASEAAKTDACGRVVQPFMLMAILGNDRISDDDKVELLAAGERCIADGLRR